MGEQRTASSERETGGLFVQGLGHEVAVVVGEAAAAVEVDGGIAVVDFEVKDLGAMISGGLFGKLEELRANSLLAVPGFDEKLVNPGASAAVFEAVVEADDQVGDGSGIFPHDKGDAVDGILQEFGQIGADGRFVEGLFPGIVELHVAHQDEEDFEIGKRGLGGGGGHGFSNHV